MTRRHQVFDARGRAIDDADAFEANGAIKDGHSMRVPMEFMDSMQRSVADAKRRKTTQFDPFGRVKSTFEEEEEADSAMTDAELALHRPGYRTSTTVNDDEAVRAYNDSVRETCNAWRTSDQGAPHIGPRAGDPCMTDDKEPGHWVREGDAMVCRATSRSDAVPRTMTAADAQVIRDRAWQEMVEATHNAWRSKS